MLFAALIAVYFITERITSPLKDISNAAKQFAKGKFDVRINVRGSDEIARLALAMNNMAESLDNYDTMRNTFMSNVSHDLRSPMTSAGRVLSRLRYSLNIFWGFLTTRKKTCSRLGYGIPKNTG